MIGRHPATNTKKTTTKRSKNKRQKRMSLNLQGDPVEEREKKQESPDVDILVCKECGSWTSMYKTLSCSCGRPNAYRYVKTSAYFYFILCELRANQMEIKFQVRDIPEAELVNELTKQVKQLNLSGILGSKPSTPTIKDETLIKMIT
jgi:hypothetical protein